MAKQSAKASAKATKAKKAAPGTSPAPEVGAETMPDALEGSSPPVGELPSAVPSEAAVPPEAPESSPETGNAAVSGEGAQSVPEKPPAPLEGQTTLETDAPETLPAPSVPPQAKSEGRRAVVRSPKGLNLRAGPALSYESVAVLPDGMEVTALALPEGITVSGWELVHTGERAGWASARFLRLLEG